ncbi:MAG TPA: class I SAM-dependent methyltransferase [Usitatibacter sp.]|jgi:predicted O-methyltransferase YrrM|nr:class I SAM-dependent methyltransferase [Usitatibacter sp.]
MNTTVESPPFAWSERLEPELLKSPWWIGHIPFAFELVGRLRPRIIVELGTYSGSSFAAFCQAVQAAGVEGKCYGIDLWEGDIHMGKFDETLYREISGYVDERYPGIAHLLREDFNSAAGHFADGSVDLLHIDGTHTYEAVANDFNTWLPKVSSRGVVLFHDVNVNYENTGPASEKFGVRRFFDEVKVRYPHFDFAHCWGLGVLVVGPGAPAEVAELVRMSQDPSFRDYFARKGGEVSRRFEAMGVALPQHSPYEQAAPSVSPWRARIRRVSDRLFGARAPSNR